MLSNRGVAIKRVHEGWCWGGSTVCRHNVLGGAAAPCSQAAAGQGHQSPT